MTMGLVTRSATDKILEGQQAKLAYEYIKPILDKIRTERTQACINTLRANELSVDGACCLVYSLDILALIEDELNQTISAGNRAQLKEIHSE